MDFQEALALQPLWVQLWSWWMIAVTLAAATAALIQPGVRREGAAILLLNVGAGLVGAWIFQSLGFVRLIGLGHLLFWTPLAYLLWRRLAGAGSAKPAPVPARWLLWALLATILLSLPIDLVDAARYLLGERAPRP